ncbi:fatty-acid--CoA ligase [Rhizocola hellebori]|uniref:Acyl-CoA synthetase n=1 Tax=Rhizocola hellebori TaxID=1392758 RepID=A0A8J3Q2Q9_9ACTN|nr:AMP-binding protein [Rhizocola hellebori]GIH02348.1 fatty-acid--CoA ligase [Rhizocola hellebori]
MKVKSLCEAFQITAARAPQAVALRASGQETVITWGDYARRVARLAAGLRRLAVSKGDTIALMMANRPEFHLADTAAIHLGAVPFSIYNTSSAEQISHIIANSGAKVVICEKQYADRMPPIEHLILVEELTALEADPDDDFEQVWRSVQAEDLLTLIYTSGTTGPAKGVELTHANLLAEADAVTAYFDPQPGDRSTSYLPSAHIADRLSSHYLQMLYGAEITCVSDPRALIAALPSVRPTFWVAVPRVWEKMKARIEEAVLDASPLRRAMFRWALARGYNRTPVLWPIADRVVLLPVRRKIGLDQVRWAMSGAAAIPLETLEFFLALGIRVCEVWGMSETCGAGTANPPGKIKPGTVGLPLPGAQIRLDDDGEVLIKGPMIMKSYRGEPALTAEALDEQGWLRTGDIGSFDADGYLSIVDRKKELIINAAGKNMSPTNIENAVKAACPLVAAVVVIGDAKPYNVALISLDADAVAAFTARNGAQAIPGAIEAGVAQGNARLSRVEQIKRYTVLEGSWDPGGDELTPTLKLRRRAILAKYTKEIAELYR